MFYQRGGSETSKGFQHRLDQVGEVFHTVRDALMKESSVVTSRGARGGKGSSPLPHLGGVKGCPGSSVKHLSHQQQARLCGDRLTSAHKGCPVLPVHTDTLKPTLEHMTPLSFSLCRKAHVSEPQLTNTCLPTACRFSEQRGVKSFNPHLFPSG